MLRLGLVTYGLERPLSGTTRVARELGRALAARDDLEVYFLRTYRHGPFADRPGAYLPGCRLLPGLMLLGGPLITLAARTLRLDIVHDPVGVAPFTLGHGAGRFKRVVTIHDAIAFSYPQGYPWLNNLLHRTYVRMALRNVDAIATVSNHARAEIARHYRLSPAAITVVPNGVTPLPHAAPSSSDGSYALYVGAFQARKNLLGLLDAFDRVRRRRPDLRLVVVGPRPWRYPELAARLERAPGVQVRGYVTDVELGALYAGAAVYVLPSLYEGFGMPALEAMAAGAPVVCSNATSLPEVVGDAALLVDPRDVDAMAEAIERIVADRRLADDLRARGRARASLFTWERAATDYIALYRSLIG